MDKYKKETISAYDENAVFFSNKFKRLMNSERRYEFQRFTDLLHGKKILDLGCGSGDHSDYFVKQGLEVISIDLSKEMIKLCKKKNLNAYIMDIEDLKFPMNSFDGIWAVTSLLHIPKSKIGSVVKKLYQILKREGLLYVCLKKGEGERWIEDNDLDSKRFFSFWKMEDLIKLFENKFNLIESKETSLEKTVFLHLLLRKR